MKESTKKDRENFIYSYYQAICNGNVVVGKWIRLVYEYIMRGFEEKRFFYDAKKAYAAIEWIEKHAFHTEGRLAPGNLNLELWQKALLSCLYGVLDENGNRQFRECILIVARKNGKSLFAAAIGKYEWQVNGGYGSRVFVVAPKLDQADIVYNNIWLITTLDPEWQELRAEVKQLDSQRRKINDDSELPRHRQTDLYLPATNGQVKKIAFSAKKSDGFNPSLCICDEVASWEGDNGLKQYEVMKSAMGARTEPLMLSCSTAGYVNDSIFDELVKRSTRMLMGESKETRLLPFLYMIDDTDKWNDINELQKSNPNLNVSVSVDYLLEEVAIAEGSLSKKAEFMTKYCNVKQNSSLAWLESKVVAQSCGEELRLDDFRGSYCVAGLDLSQTTDLTCACVVIEKDGELYVFAKFWLPTEKIEIATARDNLPYNIYIERGLLAPSGDNFIDYHDCFNWYRMLVEEYEILPLMVGYDRYSAQYLIQDMKNYGFQTDDVYQGDNLWVVLQEIEGLLKDGKIHIGDNDLLKIHMLNSAIKMSIQRGRGKLVKITPSAHIDGMAAMADAFTVRQKWYGELGDRLRN